MGNKDFFMKKYEQIEAIIDKNLSLYLQKYPSNIKILHKNIKNTILKKQKKMRKTERTEK
jgi:hypothetical protein